MADFNKELKKFVEYMGSAVLTGANKRPSEIMAEYNAKQETVYTITDATTGGTFVLTLDGEIVTPESTLVYHLTDLPYVLTATRIGYVTQVIDVVPTRAEMIAKVKVLTVTLIAE